MKYKGTAAAVLSLIIGYHKAQGIQRMPDIIESQGISNKDAGDGNAP